MQAVKWVSAIGAENGVLCHRVEVWVQQRWWEVWSDNGVEKLESNHELRNWDWTTRCAERWGVVSIIWLRKAFKNCLSLFVSKNRSQ